MTQRLLRSYGGKIRRRSLAEGAAGTGQDQAFHGRGLLPLEALEDGIVLAVDRKDTSAHLCCSSHHQLAGHHQDFLARNSQILVVFQGVKCRLEAGCANDGDQHEIRIRQSGQSQ